MFRSVTSDGRVDHYRTRMLSLRALGGPPKADEHKRDEAWRLEPIASSFRQQKEGLGAGRKEVKAVPFTKAFDLYRVMVALEKEGKLPWPTLSLSQRRRSLKARRAKGTPPRKFRLLSSMILDIAWPRVTKKQCIGIARQATKAVHWRASTF